MEAVEIIRTALDWVIRLSPALILYGAFQPYASSLKGKLALACPTWGGLYGIVGTALLNEPASYVIHNVLNGVLYVFCIFIVIEIIRNITHYWRWTTQRLRSA
jgi:hypothetical protein